MGGKHLVNKNIQKAGSWVIDLPPEFRVLDDRGSQREFRVDLRMVLLLKWFQQDALPLICPGSDGETIRIVASGTSGSGNTCIAPCRDIFPHGTFIKVIHNAGAPFMNIQTQELQSLAILQRAGLFEIPIPNLVFIGGWMVDNSEESIRLTGSMVSPNIQTMIETDPVVQERQRGIYVQEGGPFALIISERLNVVWDEVQSHYKEIESGNRADFRNISHVLLFLEQSAMGLQVLHNKGIVHNDIKPDNIGGVAEGGRLTFKITDMGLISEGRCEHAGTLGFADIWNPPQGLPEGAKKDVYSLGKTILVVIGLPELLDGIDGMMPIERVVQLIQTSLGGLDWFPVEYVASMTHLLSFMLVPDRAGRIAVNQVLDFIQRMRQGDGQVAAAD